MRISLCIITKNEEQNIKKCIESVDDVVFEKIVVDTGSEDKTIEIAKSMGARIYNFKWINDFSAARNYAISIAKGDWIIFLDADEYFDRSKKENLKKIIKKADKNNVDCILSKIINISKNENEVKIQSLSETIRVFKNKKEIKYEGAIHEFINNKLRQLSYYNSYDNLTVYHTGYSPEEIKRKDKSKRNLDLLYKQLERDNNNAQINFYIAESLMMQDQDDKAVGFLEVAKNDKSATKQLMYSIHCRLLVCIYSIEEISLEKAFMTYQDAMQYDQNCPDFDKYFADILVNKGQYNEAIFFYESCLTKLNTYNYSFESHVITGIQKVYEQLLNLYVITKDDVKIVNMAVKILKLEKYNYKILLILMKILSDNEKEEDVYNFIIKLYSEKNMKDILILLKSFKTLNLIYGEKKLLSLLPKDYRMKYLLMDKK